MLNEFSTCDDVLRFAGSRADRSWRYVILGKAGPTGKTHLCNMLCENGYNAIEITEEILDLVEYNDNKNHFKIDYMKKLVVIILNKKLPEHIYPGKKDEDECYSEFESALIDTRAEAEAILYGMKVLAEWYGCATKNDLMHMMHVESRPEYNDYCWTLKELNHAIIVRSRYGYILKLPRSRAAV